MPEQSAHDRHRHAYADCEEHEVSKAEHRRPGGSREHRQNRSGSRQAMQSAHEERRMFVLMFVRLGMGMVRFVAMPMRVGWKPAMLMKMQMGPLANEFNEHPDTKANHHETDAHFGRRGERRRQILTE
jgi:hypothetical protein